MKISVIGIQGVTVGKHNVKDPRLDQTHTLVEADKKTYAQVDTVGEEGALEADVVLTTAEGFPDLILKDLEFVETRLGRNPPEAEKAVHAPPPAPTPSPPVEAAMSPEERQASLQRIVADTTAASAAVKKCSGRELLPDQESVFETTRSLLSQTRTAVGKEELWRAESLARKARQLALSLECR